MTRLCAGQVWTTTTGLMVRLAQCKTRGRYSTQEDRTICWNSDGSAFISKQGPSPSVERYGDLQIMLEESPQMTQDQTPSQPGVLLPCAFCGAAPMSSKFDEGGVWIACMTTNCPASGITSGNMVVDPDIRTNAWNRRPSMPTEAPSAAWRKTYEYLCRKNGAADPTKKTWWCEFDKGLRYAPHGSRNCCTLAFAPHPSPSNTGVGHGNHPAVAEAMRKALEKFSTMSPEEVEAMFSKEIGDVGQFILDTSCLGPTVTGLTPEMEAGVQAALRMARLPGSHGPLPLLAGEVERLRRLSASTAGPPDVLEGLAIDLTDALGKALEVLKTHGPQGREFIDLGIELNRVHDRGLMLRRLFPAPTKDQA